MDFRMYEWMVNLEAKVDYIVETLQKAEEATANAEETKEKTKEKGTAKVPDGVQT